MIKVSEIKNVTRAIVAAVLKCHPTSVNKMRERGLPINPDGKTYNLIEAVAWRMAELAMQNGAACEDPQAVKWLTEFRKERARKTKIERQVLEEKLIEVDEVERVGFEAGKQIRNIVLLSLIDALPWWRRVLIHSNAKRF